MLKVFVLFLSFSPVLGLTAKAERSQTCSARALLYISKQECLAISQYKQVEYTDINYFLRKGRWNSRDLSSLLKLLQSGVAKLPLYRGVVYRGVSFEGSPKLFKDYTQVGNVVSDPAFASSSMDRKIAESFLTDNGDSKFVLMVIKSETGRDIQGIGAQGIDQAEKEILFLPNTKFKVIDVKKVRIDYPEYGLHRTLVYEVHLQEINVSRF